MNSIRLNLGAGANEIPGFTNLDAASGWRFEDGFPLYQDGSVEAISISHSLMYVAVEEWPAVFAELARVLQPGGVVRVTEDATDDPASERFGGWHDAVTLTSAKRVRKHLRLAGLVAKSYTTDTTGFRDGSLLQAWHGAAPKCFWIEGRKPGG